MKLLKRSALVFLAAAVLLSLAACAGTTQKTVLFSYEGEEFYSGTFSFMLSSEKAYYEQYFNYINSYYNAGLGWSSVMDEETGKTYGDVIEEGIILNPKCMLIVDYFCKQYGLELTDESAVSTVEEYIRQDMENAGGNEYELNLAYSDYGVDIDMVRDFYMLYSKMSLLQDYLYGENGIQKIAESAVRESFEEQYYKLESIYFSYYSNTANTELKELDEVTDEAIAEYFAENYVKVRHILFKTIDSSGNSISDSEKEVKKAQAQELFDKIISGETTFDDNYDKSEDPGSDTYPEGYVFTKGEMVEEFETAAFDMEVGEYRLVETPNGWHIMNKVALEEDDIEEVIISSNTVTVEEACREALTKQIINQQAQEFYDKIESGDAVFGDGGEDAEYEYDDGTVFKQGEGDETLEKAALELETGETAAVVVDDYGTYIIRRIALSDEDFESKYSTVESALISEAYAAYLDSFIPGITVNEEELAKYDITTAKSLLITN